MLKELFVLQINARSWHTFYDLKTTRYLVCIARVDDSLVSLM
jgi:hypothetical protein